MSPSDGRDGAEPTILQALIHGRTLFSMLMFSIFAVMVYVAWGYAWPANFLPFVIGFPGMALSALQIAIDVKDFLSAKGDIDPRTDFEKYMAELSEHTGGLELDYAKEKVETLVEDNSLVAKNRNRQELILFGYFFFLLAIVLFFGFWIGTPIFLLLFLRFYAKESWKLSLIVTGGVWASMYFVLVILLSQVIWEGHITRYIMDTYLTD